MKTVNVHEAKAHLSRLARVQEGEEIGIAKAGKPVARLVPAMTVEKRILGSQRGRFIVPNEFDAPLPDEVLDAFEGKV